MISGRPRILRRSELGYSLLELMVTLTILAVAVLAATSLIVQAMRLLATTTRSLQDPQLEMAQAWLRSDIHQAASLSLWSWSWSSSPMVLRMHDGEQIAYRLASGAIERLRYDQRGAEIERRPLLRGAEQWLWRATAGGLIEIQVQLRLARDPISASFFEDPTRLRESRLQTENLRIALRGSSGGRAW